jgi:hypothetical protein
VDDSLILEATNLWQALSFTINPDISNLHSQKLWDGPICDQTFKSIFNTALNPVDKARLLASQEKESGAYLNAIPSSNTATLLTNDIFQTSIRTRLGLPVVAPHLCFCGEPVDKFGLHGLSCQKSKGRLIRHATINDIIHRGLSTANIPSTLEPIGCNNIDNKRPDGMTMIPISRGKPWIWDFTCRDTYAQSYINQTSLEAGKAAKLAEELKRNKYSNLLDQFHFIPIAIETSGVFGNEAKSFIKWLGNKIYEVTKDRRCHAFLVQRISLALQRSNVISILGSLPTGDGLNFF